MAWRKRGRGSLLACVLAMYVPGGSLAAQQVPAERGPSVWDGIYTAEQAQRGDPLYASECAYCHGPDLEGGELAPALEGSEFVWRWNGLTVGDLFERLRTSMPQDEPGRVSRRKKADVLAYILSRNEFPIGARELAFRTEMLAQIVFEAIKPDA